LIQELSPLPAGKRGEQMINLHPPLRRARLDDALALAELVNMAGEGLPLYLWTRMAGAGKSPWEIGQERARREVGAFSYRNAIIREHDNQVAACLIGYPLDDDAAPADYSELPPMFVPLQQLEDMVPGTWYVNVLATYPDHRGKGFGQELLKGAEAIAAGLGKRGLSIIVADSNARARKLYERQGYSEHTHRPMVKEAWQNAGTHWVLLVKPL
jgi:ribosomal protein S18 acetylase RimI-like enzyme